MTKKHFVEMARYIRVHQTNNESTNKRTSAYRQSQAFIRGMVSMCIHLGRTYNPRFDVARFRKAAGVGEES